MAYIYTQGYKEFFVSARLAFSLVFTRNILRLTAVPHRSMCTMELELRSSYHTIRKVLNGAEKDGICWPLSDTVTYEMLLEVLFPDDTATHIYTQFCEKYRSGQCRCNRWLCRKRRNVVRIWIKLRPKWI